MKAQEPNHESSSTNVHFSGPIWDNSNEYESIDSIGFQADLKEAQLALEDLKQKSNLSKLLLSSVSSLTESNVEACTHIAQSFEVSDKFNLLASNLSTFVNCILSLNGADAQARQMQAEIQNLSTNHAEAMQPVFQILINGNEGFLAYCVQHPSVRAHQFSIEQKRWFKPHLLSLAEETLCTRLSLNGLTAWGTLYTNISTSLKCFVETLSGTQTVGAASANSLLKSDSRPMRHSAYTAIKSAWEGQQESCAAILNALAGWRINLAKRRSDTQELHFLDSSLHASRIQLSTLNAMMEAVEEAKDLGRKSLHVRAKALGIEKMAPWDLFAPAPQTANTELRHTFASGIEIIQDSFASVHPDMGSFVSKMEREKWIEGSVGNSKRPGAYCSSFPKSRSPRVYMTYQGSNSDIGTLAHELGHAFHNWVMRDLPLAQTSYPMTLAETASIFAETLVNDKLAEKARNAEELLPILWDDISNIDSLLLNIPARFAFEKRFYEQRSQKLFNPADFCELMRESWQTYYGDALSEMDEFFWCSKLHFHLSSTSFYNFPYTFGYLFSLGIYAHSKVMGNDFYPAYVALLRDTGRMTAEDLAQKHLGVSLSNIHFWRASIAIARTKLSLFEKVLSECSLSK